MAGFFRFRSLALLGLVASLAACSGATPDEGPVTLTYWTWAPGIPDIDIVMSPW